LATPAFVVCNVFFWSKFEKKDYLEGVY